MTISGSVNNKYQETIDAWDHKAMFRSYGAFHPAGQQGEDAFYNSGMQDAAYITEIALQLGCDPKRSRILDFGCGFGRVSRHLTWNFEEVHVYDSSLFLMKELAYQQLMLKHWPHNMFCYDIESYSKAYEFIFSISVFIHHTYADGLNMMEKLARTVHEGGYLLLQIPIYDKTRECHNWTDVTVWTAEQFYKAAKHCGLEVVEIHTNPGEFSYDNVGANHHELQILKKPL